ncbi:MAG: ABC transporter ATP-binding protein [Candidatus Limivicinus sp.]|nr:ABC transporter ATP-binding protein [Candidatus Limivicinus sp.]
MKKIFAYLKPYRGGLILGMLLMAISTVCELLLPDIMSDILNTGVYNADLSYIFRCCAKMLAVALVSLGSVLGGWYISSKVVAGFCADLRQGVFRKVNDMRFEDISRMGSSALLTRSTHDVGTLSWVASMLSGSIITIPVLFIGGVVLALGKDAVLSLVLLLFIPLVFAAVVRIGKKIEPLWETSDKYMDKQNDIVRERLHGIRVIRAFNSEPREHKRIEDATQVMAENIIRANVSMGVISPLSIALMNMAVVLIVYLGGFRMERGLSSASGGDIFAVIQYITLIMNGVVMAAFSIVMYPHAKVAAKRIGEVLDVESPAEPEEEELHFSGDIRLENLSFGYEGAAENAVSEISLHIRPGQQVAVIGGTGSGKSTLVQLLMGFRRPSAGHIFFDGRDSVSISPKTIRENISCVLQKAAIYSGSIRKNIAMGRPGATDEELLAAAEIAQMGDYLASLPEGLDHELTQSGKNLSGGQKQRICIARAVLKNAPIYIFDDSFSALDFLTEARLRKALSERTAGKTRIVITQRVSSAMSCDCIFVMDKGRLVDAGSHQELLERCKIYQEIYVSQTGGERR